MAFPAVLQSKIHVASIPQLTQDNLRDSEFKLDLPNHLRRFAFWKSLLRNSLKPSIYSNQSLWRKKNENKNKNKKLKKKETYTHLKTEVDERLLLYFRLFFIFFLYSSSLYFFAAISRPFACRSFILTRPLYSPRLFMVIWLFARTQL